MKRTVRSCLALILVVSMILGVSGIAYAAESTDAVQYVSLGDSMTNGYGLDGYLLDDGTNVNGYLQNDVEGAYPYLFQQYLKEQGSEVELTQLAMSGIRAEEVYYLLSYGSDNTFRADDYTLRAGYDRFDDTDLGKIDTGASGVANVAAKYQNSVKNADVLSLGLGNNNFGTFLTQRLCWYLTNNYGFNFGGNYYKTDLQALLASVDAELADQAMVIYEKALEILENQLIEQGVQDETLRGLCTTMAEAAVYSYVGFVISYAGILDYIAAKNPDAQVIIVGMANSLEGLEIVLPAEEGEKRATIDLGQFFGYVVDSANLYMAGLPAAYQVKAGIDAAVNSETASGLDVV